MLMCVDMGACVGMCVCMHGDHVCMSVCVQVYVHVCMCRHVCTCVQMYGIMCACVCSDLCARVPMYVHMHVCCVPSWYKLSRAGSLSSGFVWAELGLRVVGSLRHGITHCWAGEQRQELGHRKRLA